MIKRDKNITDIHRTDCLVWSVNREYHFTLLCPWKGWSYTWTISLGYLLDVVQTVHESLKVSLGFYKKILVCFLVTTIKIPTYPCDLIVKYYILLSSSSYSRHCNQNNFTKHTFCRFILVNSRPYWKLNNFFQSKSHIFVFTKLITVSGPLTASCDNGIY